MLYNKKENTYLIDEEDAVLLYGKKEYIKMRKSGDIVTVTMKSLKPQKEKQEPKSRRRSFDDGKTKTSNKRVICIETGEVFDSIKEVSLKYGFNGSNICACCKGRVKSANGYHWRYA